MSVDEKMDIGTIRHVAAKILIILEKLHSLGVVHRDLKVLMSVM